MGAEGIQLALQNIPAYGTAGLNGTISGNGVLRVENFLDETLPNPLLIHEAISWFDGETAIPSTTYGNVAYAIDPGSAYMQSGWPQQQKFEPVKISTLIVHEIFPGGSRKSWEKFSTPRVYRSGDGIIIAPELAGGLPRPFLALIVDSDTPISQWPVASYLFNLPQDTATGSGGSTGYSARSFVPGSVATQVRVHFNHLAAATSDCTIDHASVGIQSGSTSSTVSVPVPLTVAGQAAFNLYPDTGIWSDWVNLSVSAGQNLLVTGSLFNSGGNFWSMTQSGMGSWVSTGDSWNTANMQGTVSASPHTQLIDKAQYR